jgi:hypothetical protein
MPKAIFSARGRKLGESKMKKMPIMLVLVGLINFGLVAQGGIHTFTPPSATSDLGDLDHSSYYTWGILWNVPTGEMITGAQLVYTNIYDWTVEDDVLYTHLLTNNVTSTQWVQKTDYKTVVIVGTDNEGGGDKFADKGPLLDQWNDPQGGYARNYDRVVNIPHYDAQNNDLFAMLSDGNIGFGIDPDCHYYNQGVTLSITTCHMPAPGAVILGIAGLALVGRIKRRFS